MSSANNPNDSPNSITSRSRPEKPAGGTSRVTSPIRHISHRRVQNKENVPLNKRGPGSNFSDYSSMDGGSYLAKLAISNGSGNLSIPGNFNNHSDNDQESIVYHKAFDLGHESSVNYIIPPNSSAPYTSSALRRSPQPPSEYYPTLTTKVENLPWSEILPYYLPILSWVYQYSFSHFIGDLIGGLSLSTFQIPLCLSYANSLAHLPVICGLYSLGISPLIYMVFGSVPQMVVGPEAPISLIVGQAVEPLLHHAKKKNLDPIIYVVAITFVSGATLLGFGLGRFGFLDNVLNESLLKGFISGVGIVMIINALIAMLGLNDLLSDVISDPEKRDIHSTFDKFTFLIRNYNKSHPLTAKISFAAFFFIMIMKLLKSYASNSKNKLAQKSIYIPEILILVLISTWLCHCYGWDNEGIEIIGPVKNDEGTVHLYNPISADSYKLIKKLCTSGFLCAMLGFFESTTALKSLGSTYNLPISSNRELVALGCINLFGSVFGALPAFGGYGRSKINAISAKTTTLGAIMGLITLLTSRWATGYLYYIPKCVLSVITGTIGISLISEAPHELYFHWVSSGYNELTTFAVTVLTTLFFSMEAGIAVGLVYLLIRVIKHSAESRIQILGRCPGTNTFLDADIASSAIHSNSVAFPVLISHDQSITSVPNNLFEKLKHTTRQYNVFTDDNFRPLNTQVLEEIEGCLIIKIPEPLTFVNCSDLKSRLKRVEMYGSTRAHPALKRSRDASMTQYIIFDLKGMTEIDSSAVQMLKSTLLSYQQRAIKSFFVRVHKDEALRKRLQATGIVDILVEDLESIRCFKSPTATKSPSPPPGIDVNTNPNLDADESDSGGGDITESEDYPFFQHISDALKVIDDYDSDNLYDDSRSSRSHDFV